MARYYTFGEGDNITLMTLDEAMQSKDPAIIKRIVQIRNNSTQIKRCRDGFESGWQPNINKYCSSRREYDKELQHMGLVELGYDRVPTDSTKETNPCANEEFVKTCKDIGIELSGNEAEAIKSGQFFSADKCDLSND